MSGWLTRWLIGRLVAWLTDWLGSFCLAGSSVTYAGLTSQRYGGLCFAHHVCREHHRWGAADNFPTHLLLQKRLTHDER